MTLGGNKAPEAFQPLSPSIVLFLEKCQSPKEAANEKQNMGLRLVLTLCGVLCVLTDGITQPHPLPWIIHRLPLSGLVRTVPRRIPSSFQ